jgi:hypothetical protein
MATADAARSVVPVWHTASRAMAYGGRLALAEGAGAARRCSWVVAAYRKSLENDARKRPDSRGFIPT